MSGTIARTGFLFQDLYLLQRVLQAVANGVGGALASAAGVKTDALAGIATRFGLEARPVDALSPPSDQTTRDWDFVVLEGSILELGESKSGAVTKDDRIAFWRRLRRELVQPSSNTHSVTPVLVVDPDRIDDLERWNQLAAEAAKFKGAFPQNEPTRNVTKPEHLLDEALWHLCGSDPTDAKLAAAARDKAVAALRRFTVSAHRFDALEQDVMASLTLLFPNGMTDAIRNGLLGWMNNRAAKLPQRRFFSVAELLADQAMLVHSQAFESGTLERWHRLWNELPRVIRARTRLTVGGTGGSVPLKEAQLEATAAIAEDRPALVVARGGAGKSVFLLGLARVAEAAGLVFVCGANDVKDAAEAEQVGQMLRFRYALNRLTTPGRTCWFFLDGLDEADPALRAQWVRLLARLAADHPGMRFVASIRESVHRKDGVVRGQLSTWKLIPLNEWSPALVNDLLAKHGLTVSGDLLKLLQTPIMLDVFWRTFVENPAAKADQLAKIRTRHDLLAAFWFERVLHAPRHAAVGNLAGKIADFALRASAHVGSFPPDPRDAEAIGVLRAEGVLEETSRLTGTSVSFRHALLRDFVFAMACLHTRDAAAAVQRWFGIKGGFERDGALRAIAEALVDPAAAAEFGGFTVGDFIGALLKAHPTSALQVAQFIAEWKSLDGLDPAAWRPEVIRALPPSFGRQIVNAARTGTNPAWAAAIEHWPEAAAWTDEEYLNEAIHYTALLGELAINDATFAAPAKAAARAVRRLARGTRFARLLGENWRFQASEALRCAMPELPDLETLKWVRAELGVVTYRTRAAVLDNLREFAAEFYPDVAEVYCAAIGLDRTSSPPKLDSKAWQEAGDMNALEDSLTGTPVRPGLVQRSPGIFLPVLLDLAEAHHRLAAADPSTTANQLRRRLEKFAEEANAPPTATGRIDDHPNLTYWHRLQRSDAQGRLLSELDSTARSLAQSAFGNFIAMALPLLRASPLASVHTILLDILFDHPADAAATRALVPSLLDPRLHDSTGTEFWLRVGVERAWPTMTVAERDALCALLKARFLADPENRNARQLLCRIPAGEEPPDLAAFRYPDGAEEIRPLVRPTRSVPILTIDPGPVERHPAPGIWPPSVGQAALDRLRHAMQDLGDQQSPDAAAKAQSALAAAQALLPQLLAAKSALAHNANAWLWADYAAILDACHERRIAVDPAFVRACADLAFEFLETFPTDLKGDLPTKSPNVAPPNIPWRHAWHLADAALVLPPLVDEPATQQKLTSLIERVFASGDVWLQYLCVVGLRYYHWTRDAGRQDLLRRCVFRDDIEPDLLKRFLQPAQWFPAETRVEVMRWLLDRSPTPPDSTWADWMGQFCGFYAIRCGPKSRDPMAAFADTVVSNPEASPFLKPIEHQIAFLHGFAFGMKEAANGQPVQNIAAAPAYGRWMRSIWQFMQRQGSDEETAAVIIFSMAMFEAIDPPTSFDPKPWWNGLVPLLEEIAARGSRRDCYQLFHHFGHVAAVRAGSTKAILGIFEKWTARMVALGASEDLSAQVAPQFDHRSWRECAGHVGDAIGALESIGALEAPEDRDRAYQVLFQLANPPVQSPKAAAALHRLRPSRE